MSHQYFKRRIITLLFAGLLGSFSAKAIAQATFSDYRAKMIEKWSELRKDQHVGANVTAWAFKVVSVDTSTGWFIACGYLDTGTSNPVNVILRRQDDPPKKDDWIIIDGTLNGITDNGAVVLQATSYKNQGYKGSGNDPQ